MLKIKESTFLKSVANLKDRPLPLRSEFAFSGRSNVGKSSLINIILERKNIAKVSRSPGKTRNINYYLINDHFYLVDLPGYGYAKVSGAEQKRWQKLIETYIINNASLKLVFILIDSRVGLKDSDRQLIDWLQFNQVKFQIILTKSDKINKNIQISRKAEIKAILSEKIHHPSVLFSAKSKTGKQEILNIISHLLLQSD
jgi:GTP-binding protein